MKQTVFTGCGTALVTPFTADAKDVDEACFEELCRLQIENRADALIVAGTTGESPVLSPEEKRRLLKVAVAISGGRVPVIAGAGSNDTEDAVRKCNEAEKEGVAALLVVTPFYNKCTQDGVVEHYYYIADRVSAPVIVYNVPSRTGFNVKPETYLALSQHSRIVGIKEAGGDLSAAAKTLTLCGEELTLYSGNDDQTVPLMSLGAKGVISVVSNLIPAVMHALTSLCLEDDFTAARRLQAQYLKLMDAMFTSVNPIPVKMALELMYKKPFPLRLPLSKLSEAETEDMKKLLASYAML